ncbi:MAG: TonB-dependent receptor [Bacteroidia bacterium]
MKAKSILLPLLFLILSPAILHAHKLKGVIVDANSGEGMVGVSILKPATHTGTLSDVEGYFEIELNGAEDVRFSFLGYSTIDRHFNLSADTFIRIELKENVTEITETVVRAKAPLSKSTQVSSASLSPKDIRLLPGFAGEADIVQSFLSFPGVKKAGDASGGMLVRGGGSDQNLVLLDGVPVYQAGHIISFYSPFQSELIKEANLYKGFVPGGFGGRLSSVMTLESAPSSDSMRTELGLGMLLAKGYVQAPIIPGKLHVQVAGRRSLPDLVWPDAGQIFPARFYDGRIILTARPAKGHELRFLLYASGDKLDAGANTVSRYKDTETELIPGMKMLTRSGEKHFSIQHNYSGKFKVTNQIYVSRFSSDNSLLWPGNELSIRSGVCDFGATSSIHKTWKKHRFDAGLGWIHHDISAMEVFSVGELQRIINPKAAERRRVGEGSLYFIDQVKLGTRWIAEGGLRIAIWQEGRNMKVLPEPKFALTYLAGSKIQIQASVLRNTQRLQKVSNSALALPTDAWYALSLDHSPQSAIIGDLGLNWTPGTWNVSLSGYYKNMKGLTEFREGALPFAEEQLIDELVQGRGVAYGTDLQIGYKVKGFQIQAAYSLSWSKRQFEGINGGREYFDRFDRRHDFNIQLVSQLNRHWHFSAAFYMASGARYTPRVAQFIMPGTGGASPIFLPVYGERNSVRLSDSHRLDIAVTYSKTYKKSSIQIQAGAYNVYNQLQSFRLETIEREGKLMLREVGLFGMMPSLSCTLKF